MTPSRAAGELFVGEVQVSAGHPGAGLAARETGSSYASDRGRSVEPQPSIAARATAEEGIEGPDAALTHALRRQIRPVNCVLILAGMYAAHRKWIQKEIDIAQELAKPIVGLKPRGQQRVPTAVSNAANEMVGWNTQSIVRAIRVHSL